MANSARFWGHLSRLLKLGFCLYVYCLNLKVLFLFQANEQISSQKSKNSEQEEIYKVKKRTIDLLPDAENNIAKLQVCNTVNLLKNKAVFATDIMGTLRKYMYIDCDYMYID